MTEENSQPSIIGPCQDCKKTIYDDEPFERVGVKQDARHPQALTSVGLFRCAECALKAHGHVVTKPEKKPFITVEQEAFAIEV